MIKPTSQLLYSAGSSRHVKRDTIDLFTKNTLFQTCAMWPLHPGVDNCYQFFVCSRFDEMTDVRETHQHSSLIKRPIDAAQFLQAEIFLFHFKW